MLKASLFAVVVAAADEWNTWKQEHGKVYNSIEEDAHRRSVFEANMARIPELQKENPLAEFGATHLSDLTDEELGGCSNIPLYDDLPEASVPNATVASSMDWTKDSTPVKDQGRCGSCWAMSAHEQIETMYAIQHKTSPPVLAPQMLVDCKSDKSQRNGCGGGDPEAAYRVVQALGGLPYEKDYPYEASNHACRFKDNPAVTIKSHSSVSSEEKMKQYLLSTGSLSVCHYTGGWSSYKGGILNKCGSGGGHCTQVAGFSDEGGTAYYKVRNSWATRFGENGFIRIKYGNKACFSSGTTVVAEDAKTEISV